MATFLQLCQRLRREAGISGTGPITVVGNTNTEYERIVDWIKKAYVDIQLLHDDWRFMWAEFTFDTTAADGSYTETEALATLTPTLKVSRFDTDSFRYFLTSGGVQGEQFMTYRYYPWFRDIWLFGANRTTQGQPNEFTFAPDRRILLAQIPNGIYTITGDFYRRPVELAADADVPIFPEEFHEIIVWWAIVNYAGYEEASAVYTHAQNMVNQRLGEMSNRERPMPNFGGPLA
jgi:hypothetical protein